MATAPNPFAIDIAQPDLSPVLEGVGALVKSSRDAAKKERTKTEFKEILDSGDMDKLYEFSVNNPDLSKLATEAIGFKNEGTRTNLVQTMMNLDSDPNNFANYLNQRNQYLDTQGADNVDTQELLTQFAEDPEQALADARKVMPMIMNKQEWGAYKDQKGIGGANQHFSGQEIFKDEGGNLFMGTGVGDPTSGKVTPSMVAIDGSGVKPTGKLSLVNPLGQTAGETIDYKAQLKSAEIRSKDDTTFYTDYIPETRNIESGISDLETTQDLLDDMTDLTDYSTVGFGKFLNNVPLTDATYWSEMKSTVQSRLALGKMMELKAASSTGSTGFGALSERELKILTDHLGSLEQAQSPAQIKKVVQQIYKSLETTKKGFRKQMRENRKRFEGLHKEYYGKSRELPSLFKDEKESAPEADPLGIL